MAGKTDGTAENVIDKVKGHDRLVIEDGDGNEFVLRYTPKTVKDMEAKGLTSERAAELLSSGTLTGAEEFVEEFLLPGFKSEQPKITKDEVLDLYRGIPDKIEFVQLVFGLFSLPLLALTTGPTETRTKFRLV